MAVVVLVAVAAGRWVAEDLAAVVVTLAAVVVATSAAAAATLAAGTSAAVILEEPATLAALVTSVAIADSTGLGDSTVVADSTGAVGLTAVARSMVAQPGISVPDALQAVRVNFRGPTSSGSPIRAWAAMLSAAERYGPTRPAPWPTAAG